MQRDIAGARFRLPGQPSARLQAEISGHLGPTGEPGLSGPDAAGEVGAWHSSYSRTFTRSRLGAIWGDGDDCEEPYDLTVIDLHSHVLPGLDDGAADLAPRSRWPEPWRRAAFGWCARRRTCGRFRPRPARWNERSSSCRRLCGAGIAIEVRGGAELALDRLRGRFRYAGAVRSRGNTGGLLETVSRSTDRGGVGCEDGLVPVAALDRRPTSRAAVAARGRGRARVRRDSTASVRSVLDDVVAARGGAGDRGIVKELDIT